MDRIQYVLAFILLLIVLFMRPYDAKAGDLPDPALTPGATQSYSCSVKTSAVRHVTAAQKRKVYSSYGLPYNSRKECAEGYEVDHLVSLELGGSNETQNLWPQSFCGQWNAHVKDKLENKLHALVCNGNMSLPFAQSCISTDWIMCYRNIFSTN